MKNFMSCSLFVMGLMFIILGVVLIVKDRLVSSVNLTRSAGLGNKKKNPLDAAANLIKALGEFAEKLFGQFAPKEKLPVFLIVAGVGICAFGLWMTK